MKRAHEVGAAKAPAGYRRPSAGAQPPYLHPPYASTVLRAPSRPLVLLPQTLSELTGPAFDRTRRTTDDVHARRPDVGVDLHRLVLARSK